MRFSLLLQQSPPSWLVRLTWMVWVWDAGSCTGAVLLGVASRICSRQKKHSCAITILFLPRIIYTYIYIYIYVCVCVCVCVCLCVRIVTYANICIFSWPMKHSFFQAVVMAILIYGCTTWTLTKRLEKKLDGNYTRMLRAILNKSWRQHPTRHQLYGHLPPITKTIQARRTRHAGHCWRSRDELISDVLLWTPTYGRTKAGRPARIYIQQLCKDTVCCPEDLPEAMNDREKWQERVRDIRASGTTWWWWWVDLFHYQPV